MKHRSFFIAISAVLVTLAVAGTAFAFSSEDDDHRAAQLLPGIQEPDDTDDPLDAEDDAGGGPDKAALIAEAFGVSPDEVAALRADGIGWGALFKLYQLAEAKGVDVDDLIAAAPVGPDGERAFAFGELKKSLTAQEAARLDDGPKNFGQVVSASRKHAKPD